MKCGWCLLLFALCAVVGLAAANPRETWPPPCRFAPLYTMGELLHDERLRNQFLDSAIYHEGHFHEVGYNHGSGLTYDGHTIDYASGQLAPPIHNFSAPSKEAIHVGLLALSLLDNHRARMFFNVSAEKAGMSVDQLTLSILEKKMSAYEKFDSLYPGFGGFLPWYGVTDSYPLPLPPAWSSQVPSLDNGEWIWALKAVVYALEHAKQPALAKRYENYVDMLAKNAKVVFYAGEGRLRTVTFIVDPRAKPSPGNYRDPPNGVGYLDDPYEGELFTFFVDLYSMANEHAEREKMWVFKRRLLQSVDYHTPSGPITVQRGWWFSSHEQWKYLEMPYLEVPINKRVFLNGERARTWNSALKHIPGMFASVNDVSKNETIPDYLAAGIYEIAFQPSTSNSVVTPYGSFPVFLADEEVATVWYHVMLSGGRMQGPLGSTEATNVTGTAISPVVTWDSKVTTVLAMTGGIGPVVSRILKKEGNYKRFYEVVDREWSRVFPKLAGEGLAFALPRNTIPTQPLGDFTQCRTPNLSPHLA